MRDRVLGRERSVKVDVINTSMIYCSRCESWHENVEFRKLSVPSFCEGVTIIAWAACPETDEPIVMAEVKKETRSGTWIL